MSKRPANLGFGSSRPDTLQESEEVATGLSGQNRPYREISLTVDRIENLGQDKIKEVMVRIEYMGKILNESQQIPVTKDGADFKLTTKISAGTVSALFLDDIMSNPVLFTLLDCTQSASAAGLAPTPSGDAKKKTSKVSSTPLIQPKSTSFNVIGMCNLDLGALAMGGKEVRKTLLVEPELKESPLEIKTWIKYPKLSVYATSGDTPLISETVSKFNNAAGVTIECIYNVPEYILSGTVFEAVIPMPTAGDRNYKIKFPNGITLPKDLFPYRKKWLSLSDQEEPGIRTPYRISQHYFDIYSTLPPGVDVKNEVKSSRRVIRWNIWRHCHMVKDDANYFYTKLMRHRLWPIEIFLSPKSREYMAKDKTMKTEKKSKPAPPTGTANPDHFMAFLDLSPFLHPGVTKVRVAAQLFTFSQAELISKFGAEFLSEYGNPTFSQQSIQGNRRKSSSVKSKSSVRDTEFENASVPVFNEDSPTFIIVEVDLEKPFTPKRNLDSYETDLRQHLCLKEKMSQKLTTFDMMKQNFSQSVANAMSLLGEEFSNFCIRFNKNKRDGNDLFIEFQKYLNLQENYHRIKATLERTIIELIKEKFGAVNQYEDEVPDIYVYLVREMHKVTNQCLVGHHEFSNRAFFNDHLQLYAEEAMEEGNYRLAKDYLILKLSRNTANPDYWLDFAVFCIRLKKYEDAIEAVREAIALDFYHQLALFMYALLMTKISNSLIAEAAFGVLLIKYPDFIEGWMALSLMYTVFSNFEGAHVAMQEATKAEYLRNDAQETTEEKVEDFMYTVYSYSHKEDTGVKYGLGSFKNGICTSEPLSWTITLCPPHNIFIRTTVLMQKLGFYEYAALCLAEELLAGSKNGKPSPHYVYYTCVNYYLQERYEEAIPILQATVKEYGKDCFLWSLMGHCFYKLDNHAEAIGCYEYVRESYNRPNDIHLVNSRMGFYYLAVNKFTCARQSLISACKYSPSPKLWKGVGIACLEMREGEEAEIAFSEANYLDNKDPETWAYLALTNAFLRRLDLFRQCYTEAKKRNLNNPELKKKINTCLVLNGFKDEE